MTGEVTAVPLFGRGFSSKSRVVTSMKLTNLYREPAMPEQDKTAMALYGTPGAKLWSAGVGTQPCRGAYQTDNQPAIVVYGSVVYWTDDFITFTAVSGPNLSTTSGPVQMSDNGVQLLIIDGNTGFILTWATLVMAAIASPNFPQFANSCCFIGGYFVVPDGSAVGRFRWSKSYDGTVWNATDFANAEFSPDPLWGVFAEAGFLYLLGSWTTEMWALSGDTRVFARVGGAGIEYGTVFTRGSLATSFRDSSVIFLGQNQKGGLDVVRLDGLKPRIISTPDISHDMQVAFLEVPDLGFDGSPPGFTNFNGLSSFVVERHFFCQVNINNQSWLYDDLSDDWSAISTDNGRHYANLRVWNLVSARPLASDYRNAKWYEVDQFTYTDPGGSAIINELITKHAFGSGNMVSFDEVFVDMETGVGLEGTGQGSDPQLMCSWSKDGGRTYGSEVFKPMGKVGAYQTRIWLWMLGRAFDWVFKFRCSEPVKVVFTGMSARGS